MGRPSTNEKCMKKQPKTCGKASKPQKRKISEDNGSKSIVKIYYKSIEIIKSPLDPRKYHAIKFPNGLQACLISTFYCENEIDHTKPLEATTFTFPEVYDFNKNYLNMYTEVRPDTDGMSLLDRVVNFPWTQSIDTLPDEEISEDDLWEPPTKLSKFKCPPNPSHQSYCISVAIVVGALHDPLDVCGLFHLLEHCIFLGTKTYPEVWTVLSENTTNANAGTDMEQTYFYANMNSKEEFLRVAHIFSEMMSCPLLDADAIQREVHSVDSEDCLKLSKDFLRVCSLMLSCAFPDHHMQRFGMGNMASLGRKDIGKLIRKYFHRYYRPKYMTVCMQGPLSTEELVQIAAQNFHTLQPTNLPTPWEDVSCEGFPFDMKKFVKMYRVFPYKNYNWMLFSWVMPEVVWKDYHAKPLEYVIMLLNHRGDTGLVYNLQEKLGWITCCHATCSSETLEQDASFVTTKFYSGIHLCLELTAEGMSKETEVIKAVYSYISLLRKHGLKRRYFDELRKLRASMFHYRNCAEKSCIEVGVSANRHRNPKLILTGPDLLSRYDPGVISVVLDHLQPRQGNIITMSKNFQRLVTTVDPVSLVAYSSYAIPEPLLQELDTIPIYSSFALPKPNIFLADEICRPCSMGLGGMSVESSLIYLRNSGKAGMEITHRTGTCGHPQYSMYNILISSSYCTSNPINIAMITLWKRILSEKIKNRLHQALLADVHFGIYDGESGLLFYLSGVSSWLPTIWQDVLDEIINFESRLEEKIFVNFKQLVLNTYGNLLIKYDTLGFAKDLYCYMTSNKHCLQMILQHNLRYNVTFSDFLFFTKSFKSRMWILAQLNGTFTYPQLELVANSITGLKYEALKSEEMCINYAYAIPPGEKCLRVKAVSNICITNTVINYYQVGILTEDEEILCKLLVKKLSNFLFTQLRTIEQLSYFIKVMTDTIFTVSSITVILVPQADKFKPGFVDERIDAALVKFYETQVESDQSLRNTFNLSKRETESDEYKTFRLFQEDETFPERLRTFYRKHLPSKNDEYKTVPSYHKLSIQVQGNLRYEQSMPKEPQYIECKRKLYETKEADIDSDGAELIHNKIFLDIPQNVRHENAYFITNIEKFRNNLFLYPNEADQPNDHDSTDKG